VIAMLPGTGFNSGLEAITGKNFLLMLMYVNLLIVAFNLIPAFPMDGGRILRALLSLRFDRLKATRYSMLAGQVFGSLFALVGIFINPFLFIIGIFVVIGARMEYTLVKHSTLLVDHQVKDILIKDYTTFRPEEPLKNAVDRLLSSAQSGFLVQENGGVIGVLTKEDIIQGLSSHGEDVQVREVMSTVFRKIDASASLRDIFKFMQKDRAGLMPVFEDQKLVGIIDQENIQEFIMVQSALRDL
jgi:predicted transcriptional regulator